MTESNRLKHNLAAGKLALIAGNHETTDMVDHAGSLGLFDGVWIDMQHGAVPVDLLPDMSRAADLWGMTSLVRVRANDPTIIGLTITAGVQGVIVPHVNSKLEAERVVAAAKFPPLGHRSASGGRRSYGRSVAAHQRIANDETFVAVMIEDIEALENLEEIIAVPNIDMFFVAHYDLALSMGLGADVEHPKLVETYDRAIERIVAAGRTAGAVVKEADLEKYLAMGVRCVKIPTWQSLVASGARSFAERAQAVKL